MSRKRALISLSDKQNIEEVARALIRFDYEIISSGGTFRFLQDCGIPVTPVDEVTGFPEILDGRVKTLHPHIHGGILARREAAHMRQLAQHKIELISTVIVNLYPFEKATAREDISLPEAVEQIDIGGPTLLRAAAKNFHWVTVLSDPDQYPAFMEQLQANGGDTDEAFRKQCAVRVFQTLARYNASIADYLNEEKELPQTYVMSGIKEQALRYGENPHQRAAWYKAVNKSSLGDIRQLHGRELSFNNLLDIQAALNIVAEFESAACVIIKHNNPCGIGTAENLSEAHKLARSTDPVSSFGSIISFNRVVDAALAEELASFFTECIVAPGFEDGALQRLRKKKNLRLLTFNPDRFSMPEWDVKVLSGGFLVQETDRRRDDVRRARVVTKRTPTEEEWQALDFAWKTVRHVKSNAIVFTNARQTLGIGAGQMSRVDSTEIAIKKAQNAALSLKNSAVASDAFFPFKDGVEALIAAGATAVIQPGGSIRDEEVIEAADKAGITMVFSGSRHFKH